MTCCENCLFPDAFPTTAGELPFKAASQLENSLFSLGTFQSIIFYPPFM